MSVTCHKRAGDQLDLHAKVAGLHVPVAGRKPAAASVSNSIEKSIERGHEDSPEASAPTNVAARIGKNRIILFSTKFSPPHVCWLLMVGGDYCSFNLFCKPSPGVVPSESPGHRLFSGVM